MIKPSMTVETKKALEVLASEKEAATSAYFRADDGDMSADEANVIIDSFNSAFIALGGQSRFCVKRA